MLNGAIITPLCRYTIFCMYMYLGILLATSIQLRHIPPEFRPVSKISQINITGMSIHTSYLVVISEVKQY